MKRRLICIFSVLLIVILVPFSVSAEDKSLEDQFFENTGPYLDDSVTDEAREYFSEKGITIENAKSLTSLSVSDIFKYVLKNIKYSLGKPMRLLGFSIAVIVLIAVVESLNSESTTSSIHKIIDIIGVLICIIVLYKYISDSIELTSKTLTDGSTFMTCFVPVFASVVGASGGITSAGVYNTVVLIVAQGVIYIAKYFLLPMMGVYMSMAIVEAINPAIKLNSLTEGIKKILIWSISLLMTVFVGMITIQSIVGTSADSVAIRTGKFVTSSFIPVIGSAISDAYTTVRGSLGLIRSGVGTFGIIVLLLTLLPPLISLTVTKLAVAFSVFISDILGVKKVNILLKSFSSTLSIAISIMTCYTLMMIISTTVVMLIGLNM